MQQPVCGSVAPHGVVAQWYRTNRMIMGHDSWHRRIVHIRCVLALPTSSTEISHVSTSVDEARVAEVAHVRRSGVRRFQFSNRLVSRSDHVWRPTCAVTIAHRVYGAYVLCVTGQ